MKKVVGIDLGTTFSAIAHVSDGRPVTIPNAEGELTTPSIIYFETKSDIIVGREAKRVSLAEPDRVAMDVKRCMGDEHYPKPLLNEKYSPVVLSGLILKKIIRDTTSQIGPVDGAVITVPAYFDEGRRHATVQAGEAAGIRVLDILNEPTAAALAYIYRDFAASGMTPSQLREQFAKEFRTQYLLVYDLGGGTFDVTIVRIQGAQLDVIATAGDVRLGGRDWDERIFDHLAEAFIAKFKTDPREDPLSAQQLMNHAEEIKKDLSRRKSTRFAVNHAGHTLTGEITREQFEKMTEDLLFRTESRIVRVLADAGLDWEKIDTVLAVGGSTRMPQVQAMLARVTKKLPDLSLSPDEAVAHGAAIHAVMCIADQAAADPSVVSWLKAFGGKVEQFVQSVTMTNVTSHTLGVVVIDPQGRRRTSKLLKRNARLPAQIERCYGTVRANQQTIHVEVVEGESPLADECLPVGSVIINSLPSGMPKASPVQVMFKYDRSGRLHVHAKHVGTGLWSEAVIKRRNGIDIEALRMNKDILERLTVA